MAEEEKKPLKVIKANFSLLGVIFLVIIAFLGGSLWSKNRMLKPETLEQENAEEIEPQGPPILSAEDFAEISQGGAAEKGEKDAPITIIEFSEYQCPFCKRYVDEAYQQIWEEYEGKIHYIFRDFPLTFHSHAQRMAEVARCAGDQDKYWPMHDLLFEKNEEWSVEKDATKKINTYVRQLKLNTTKFNQCLTSGKFTKAIEADLALGQKMGVGGTPTFFINGQMLIGAQPFESFKTIIDAELEK